jgi:imidazolonepropionase-like amidohydrolase
MTVIDAEGRLVTPGCVDAHCHIGVHNSAMRWEGADFNERSDPLTPHMRAIDGINPMDETFTLALQHGVTSACTGPGSANVVGGTFVAIKLAGKRVDDMVIKNPVAMKCAFGENPKGVYGQNGGKSPVTRMATAALLRELLFKARNYVKAKDAAVNGGGAEPAFDMKLEAMIPVIKKEIPLKAHAHRADDIFTAIRIAKEFDVGLTLDHCTDGSLIAEELAAEGYPAFVGPSFGSKSKIELMNKDFTTPGILHKAGVPVSIITDAPVIPLEHLPMCAGFAISAGLPYEEGWRAITIHPANQTGIGHRVGSLEAGKDGDVVIWDRDPLLEIGAHAYVTVVNGRVVYSAEHMENPTAF